MRGVGNPYPYSEILVSLGIDILTPKMDTAAENKLTK